jgi:hypothetical protein
MHVATEKGAVPRENSVALSTTFPSMRKAILNDHGLDLRALSARFADGLSGLNAAAEIMTDCNTGRRDEGE